MLNKEGSVRATCLPGFILDVVPAWPGQTAHGMQAFAAACTRGRATQPFARSCSLDREDLTTLVELRSTRFLRILKIAAQRGIAGSGIHVSLLIAGIRGRVVIM